MSMKTNRKGFTVVELVIVIAVIAILAAVLIPTFSSLVKKANQSADIQLVRQMNTILKAEEAVDGKPADVEKVKEILADNGIANPTPSMENSAFAWDSVKNVVILVDTEANVGVFPNEYKGVEYQASWKPLAGNVNVSMEDLGATLDEAIANVAPGQTIVLTSNQTLTADLPANINIDLGGYKLTAADGLSMEANGDVVISNGDVDGGYTSLPNGATLTLENVNWVATGGTTWAFYSNTAAELNINGGSVIAPIVVGTSYSNGGSQHIILNVNGATLGSTTNPCKVALSLINSGETRIVDTTIYATDKCVYNRAGNVYIENSTMNYQPTADYNDTHYVVGGKSTGHNAPDGIKYMFWDGGHDGANAPIVVGDFHANHYTPDANCTLVNVTFNSTNTSYPDVYLSQENYDLILNASKDKLTAGPVVPTTTLTCDSSVKWAVNPGKNDHIKAIPGYDAFVAQYAFVDFDKYAGFEYSGSGHGGLALMYVDNVFVNGVEQAKGSTSANPIPAN